MPLRAAIADRHAAARGMADGIDHQIAHRPQRDDGIGRGHQAGWHHPDRHAGGQRRPLMAPGFGRRQGANHHGLQPGFNGASARRVAALEPALAAIATWLMLALPGALP